MKNMKVSPAGSDIILNFNSFMFQRLRDEMVLIILSPC
jgi:hypothetical protein